MSYTISKASALDWYDTIFLTCYEDIHAKEKRSPKINDHVSRREILSKIANMSCISEDATALIRHIIDTHNIELIYDERIVKLRLYSGYDVTFSAYDELSQILYNTKPYMGE